MSTATFDQDFRAAWDRAFERIPKSSQACILAAPTGAEAGRFAASVYQSLIGAKGGAAGKGTELRRALNRRAAQVRWARKRRKPSP